jgi:hypothetical protein
MRRHAVAIAVTGALLWTAFNWSGVKQVMRELHRLPPLAFLAVLCELAFDVGLALLAIGAGEKLVGGAGGELTGGLLRRLWRARRSLRELLCTYSTNRCFRIGLALNWFGAATVTGVIPMIAIVALLPIRDWGLLVLPAVDLVATFTLRLPLLPRSRSSASA